MSFWSEASGAVKGAIVVGVICLLYLGVAKVSHLAPFGRPDGADVTQVRGVQP